MSGVDLGPILFSVVGTDDYNILKYDDDDDSIETTHHTKAIIWFTSNGKQGSIELGLRFFDKSITDFVILSRCVEGKVNLGFSSNSFNVSSTVGDVTLYFEDINMNNRSIKNLGGPTNDGDVTNKKYVDTENANQDNAINSKLDKKGGTMSGNIAMAGNRILGLPTPTGNQQPVTLGSGDARYVWRDFGNLFDADINVRNNKIINLNSPTNNNDATNKKYIDDIVVDLLPRDGSRTITGNINFNDKRLNECGRITMVDDGNSPIIMNNSPIYSLPNPTGTQQPVPLGFGDGRYLKRDGSNTMTGNLKLGGKNILQVENLTDYKDTDPYDYRVKDVKSVVNKEYLNENFMKRVDKDGREYYDLKGRIIRNCEPYYDGLFSNDNDLVSKKYVDNVNENQDIAINDISSISSYNTNLITSLQTGKVDQLYVDDIFFKFRW